MATVKYNLGTVGGISATELFSGSVGNITGNNTSKITLNDDITNYKFLVFDFYCGFSNGNTSKRYYSRIISAKQFTNLFNNANTSVNISFCWGYSDYTDYFDIIKDGTTTNVLSTRSNFTQCIRIVGIN